MKQELDELLSGVALPKGISAEAEWIFVGESYEIARDEPVVTALRQAHEAVTGRPSGFAGMSAICDSNRLAPLANVPTVLYGFDNEYAHADVEQVRLARLLQPCQVVLQTVLNYLNMPATGEAASGRRE